MKKGYERKEPLFESYTGEFKTRKREQELIQFARFSNKNQTFGIDASRLNDDQS